MQSVVWMRVDPGEQMRAGSGVIVEAGAVVTRLGLGSESPVAVAAGVGVGIAEAVRMRVKRRVSIVVYVVWNCLV